MPTRVVRRCALGGGDQASVGGEADLLQIIEVPQPAADTEVVGVVNVELRVDAERGESPISYLQEQAGGADQRVLGCATVQW